MKNKRTGVIILAVIFACMLLGCGKAQVLDGSGMVNNQPWKGFTLSRTDSNGQYNFCFKVQNNGFGFLLTGVCRDENGEEYILEAEDGVELSTDDLQFLRDLWLGDLPDAVFKEAEDESILSNSPVVIFVLTWINGTEQEKELPQEISVEIYEHFLPYFKK